jgi:thioredoxin:protein disulfide reductase
VTDDEAYSTMLRPSALRLGTIAVATALACPALAFADGGDARFEAALAHGNGLLAVALTFVAGLLTSLTPCVYPMITITVSVFGATQTTKLRGFLLSLSFVEGIAAMFTALGIAAGASGNAFGTALSSPFVIAFLDLIFLAAAASMFGAFEMVLPSGLQTRLAALGGSGYAGAFVMGIVAGVIASPCTGPVLTSILALVAASGRVGFGALLLFVYAHGLGILFLLVGTFAASLPKPGRWMEAVKSVFGIIFIATAAYFAAPHVPALVTWIRPERWFLPVSVGILLAGLAIGAVHLSFRGGGRAALRKGVGIALSVVGLVGTVGWVFAAPAHPPAARGDGFHWIASETVGIARARSARKPAVLDFTASWCGACGELARATFPSGPVVAEASRFVAIRVDSSSMDDSIRALHTKYAVRGLPTVILLDSRGHEQHRITGFVPPQRFAELLRSVH